MTGTYETKLHGFVLPRHYLTVLRRMSLCRATARSLDCFCSITGCIVILSPTLRKLTVLPSFWFEKLSSSSRRRQVMAESPTTRPSQRLKRRNMSPKQGKRGFQILPRSLPFATNDLRIWSQEIYQWSARRAFQKEEDFVTCHNDRPENSE